MSAAGHERRPVSQTARCRVTSWRPGLEEPLSLDLIREAPLAVQVEGAPYAVIMRTPGDEIAHAAGFCLSEGLVDSPEDFGALAFHGEFDPHTVSVTLTVDRRRRVADLLARRGTNVPAGCGTCVRGEAAASSRMPTPPRGGWPDLAGAVDALLDLVRRQPLRDRTRATHAAALCGRDLEILTVAEDVGRHNALDKAVGRLFLAGGLPEAAVLLLSSRISCDLVQKAARAGLGYVFSISRPTSLALSLATSLGIAIGCLSPGDGLYLFDRRGDADASP